MKKLSKLFLICFSPFLVIILILLFTNTVKTDFRYAHKNLSTYQDPFNWALYKIEINLIKFFNTIRNENENGLKRVNLYLLEKSQRRFFENTPQSTKIWQNGFYLSNDNSLKKIKIRLRGDNPANWLFEKKSWRIKSRKKELFNRHRYYEYLPYDLNTYFSGYIANQTKILSPKFNLVELSINDQSKGVYIQTERINENFLRRNKLMPVNIYKGENILSESTVSAEGNLFNNHSSWTKLATFNKLPSNDKSDLKEFINALRNAENNEIYLNFFFNKIDIYEWAEFAAYQIITQNFHNDHGHNLRLIIDPWTGLTHPVIYDPIIGNYSNFNQIDLDKSSNDLLLLLNKNSIFLKIKYEKILTLLNNIKVPNKDNKKFKISLNRDSALQWDYYKRSTDNVIERNLLNERFLKFKTFLINKLTKEPLASWKALNKGFEISVEGIVPISDLVITFDNELPNFISLDLNNDNKIDDFEKFLPNKNFKFVIPVNLFANRYAAANNLNQLQEPLIKNQITKFMFFVDKSISPSTISIANPFSKIRYKLKNKDVIASKPSIFNRPIYEQNTVIKSKVDTFSGLINVSKNLILENEVIIRPGTQFLLNKNKSIIFKNKVTAIGEPENPIIFKQSTPGEHNYWGTIALHGLKTKNSFFKDVVFENGSGAIIDNTHYRSTLSVLKTSNIDFLNIKISKSKKYDDSMHIIYSNNITLDNFIIEKAFSDALDIDISSNIVIKNSKFIKPENDSIDVMESLVLIDNTIIENSGDKGISIGENSKVLINNSYLRENNIGIASKDRSVAEVINSKFINNKIQLDSYQKNLQYGDGGTLLVLKSSFESNNNIIKSDIKSNVELYDNKFSNPPTLKKKLSKNISIYDKKITKNDIKNLIKNPLMNNIQLD